MHVEKNLIYLYLINCSYFMLYACRTKCNILPSLDVVATIVFTFQAFFADLMAKTTFPYLSEVEDYSYVSFVNSWLKKSLLLSCDPKSADSGQ